MSCGVVTLRRDPFARATLVRTKAVWGRGVYGCAWCGRHGTMYNYCWVSDGGGAAHASETAQPFCSVRCYEDYNR